MVICGTGHRPDKLGGYGQVVTDKLIDTAFNYLVVAHGVRSDRMIDKVISGGALGWDQALAWATLRLKIPLIMALPFKDFDQKWPSASRGKFNLICADAAEVIYVCEEGYAPWKMQERNKWMVDHSDRVLALWNGTDGGTANCVRYAEKAGKPIINMWEKFNGTKD